MSDAELEEQIRACAAKGDANAAATAAIRGYGPAVLRFLVAMLRSEAAASDVFSLFAEGVWRGIGAFDWGCACRAWAFAIARRSALRYRRDEGRRGKRQVLVGSDSGPLAIAEEVRTSTLSFLKTERKNRFAEIRDALPPEDRELLILRVDQGLAWNDLARAFRDEGAEPLEGDALKREASRLRKRFQLVKEKLLAIGKSEGLVRSKDD